MHCYNLQYLKKHTISFLFLLISFGLLSLNLNFLAISPPFEFIQNFTHIILFLIITLVIYKALPASKYRIALTVVIASAISFTTEVFQFFGARDADILDILLNFSGIAITISWFLSKNTSNKINKYLYTFSLLFLVGITSCLFIYKLGSALYAKYQLKKMLPFLSDFEAEWELLRWENTRYADMSFSDKHVTHGNFSMKVDFYQSSFPRIYSHSIPKDWTKYNRFRFDIINPHDEIVTLNLKLLDTFTGNGYRFGRIPLKLNPGKNSFAISIKEIENSVRERTLNIQDMFKIAFYLHEPPRKYTLFFDNMRFE